MSKSILIVLLVALTGYRVLAADTSSAGQGCISLFQWGIVVGYGFENERIGEGEYGPLFLAGQVDFQLHKRHRRPGNPHYFLLYAEPQVNPVLLGGGFREWEAGCNLGIRYRVDIGARDAIFVHLGSGPHYISLDDPEHQAGGFQFATNTGFGYQRMLSSGWYISAAYRFRHISNLSIRLPNKGLDNHFFTIGFKRDLLLRTGNRSD